MMESKNQALFKRENLFWYSWGFGIEFLLVNASVYFSEWLVIENKVPDLWYSSAFIGSTIVLIFLSPYLGVTLDRKGNRARAFLYFTIATLVSGILIQVVAQAQTLLFRVSLALIFFGLLNLFYQLSGLVFNTFLKDISGRENMGKVAGIASGVSTIGDALGLLITLPIILGAVTIFGTSRISVLIPMAILSAIFCLPMYFAFKKLKDEPDRFPQTVGKFKQVWRDLKDTESYPGVLRLLLAFCFYNDAVLTLQLFAAIYLEKVYHIPDSHKAILIIAIYVSFTIGAWLGGYGGDRIGNKKILISGIILTAVTTAIISFGNPGLIIYILFSLFGIANGATFTSTKALFSNLIPYAKKSQFFGLYSISEKFASIIGPVTWGFIVYFVSSRNNLNYRAAVLGMSLFMFMGAFIARKVKENYATSETVPPP